MVALQAWEQDGEAQYGDAAERKAGSSQTGLLDMYQTRERESSKRWVSFPVFAIDTLFRGRSLAVAHLDLEGAEERALRGGWRTIARDRPLITVESLPRSQQAMHRNLTQLLASLGYDMHAVPESCGWPSDCRNYVCVPTERAGAFAGLVSALNL